MKTEHEYFLTTERVGFLAWQESDEKLAEQLWGNPEVTRYITANGVFTHDDIAARLQTEIANYLQFGVQYWQVFLRKKGVFIGCCGLRPHGENRGCYELGIHLLPDFWHKGYAYECASAVTTFAFTRLNANELFAGHHPENVHSKALLDSLGFTHVGDEFYAPTGLCHPSYVLKNPLLGKKDKRH